MVEKNEINRSLLTLLDENISSANQSNQVWPLDEIFSVYASLFLSLLDFFIVVEEH